MYVCMYYLISFSCYSFWLATGKLELCFCMFAFQLFASGLCQNGVPETEGTWGFLLPDILEEAKRARLLVGGRFFQALGVSRVCCSSSC